MAPVAPPINVSPNTRPVDASTIVEAKHLPIPASSRDCLQSSSMVRNQGNTHEPQPTQPKLCATARC
ncbi:hypothetical protein B0H10DRAFT_2024630 [Mycena sp. CBHHK59/15]|nr:hypothetical protein B0H10DRAFT_2024630 [Mycena sp. CBHHK59/15]